MMRFFLLALMGMCWLACSPADSFCNKYYECLEDEQDLDDDFVAVCVENDRAINDILASNEEKDCGELRTAKDALLACRAALDCGDFEDEFDPTQSKECDDAAEDYAEAQQDAADDCAVVTEPSGNE